MRLLALLLAAAAFLGCKPRVTGVVFRSDTGARINGAIVRLGDARIRARDGRAIVSETTTAADGAFSFPRVRPGAYYLVVAVERPSLSCDFLSPDFSTADGWTEAAEMGGVVAIASPSAKPINLDIGHEEKVRIDLRCTPIKEGPRPKPVDERPPAAKAANSTTPVTCPGAGVLPLASLGTEADGCSSARIGPLPETANIEVCTEGTSRAGPEPNAFVIVDSKGTSSHRMTLDKTGVVKVCPDKGIGSYAFAIGAKSASGKACGYLSMRVGTDGKVTVVGARPDQLRSFCSDMDVIERLTIDVRDARDGMFACKQTGGAQLLEPLKDAAGPDYPAEQVLVWGRGKQHDVHTVELRGGRAPAASYVHSEAPVSETEIRDTVIRDFPEYAARSNAEAPYFALVLGGDTRAEMFIVGIWKKRDCSTIKLTGRGGP